MNCKMNIQLIVVFLATLAGMVRCQSQNLIIVAGDAISGDCTNPAGATHAVVNKVNPLDTTIQAMPYAVTGTAPSIFDAISVTCVNQATSAVLHAFDIVVVSNTVICSTAPVTVAVGDVKTITCSIPYGGAVPPLLEWETGGAAVTETTTLTTTLLSTHNEVRLDILLKPTAAGGPTTYSCVPKAPNTWTRTTAPGDTAVPTFPASVTKCDVEVTFTEAATDPPSQCPVVTPCPAMATAANPGPDPVPVPTQPAAGSVAAPSCPASSTATSGSPTGKACTSAAIAIGVVGGVIAVAGIYLAFIRNQIKPAMPTFTQPGSGFVRPGPAFAQPIYQPVQPMQYVQRRVPFRFIQQEKVPFRRRFNRFF